jgi:glycerol-3-phosphate dehydrogenase
MRRTNPAAIDRDRFDLIVIGAGINGAAIARDASLRGLRVLLLDKSDIGSGTTSWSTRLIHGGLRYLEHAEFDLVRESLRERERLLRNAPHLVKPIPLLIPIYRNARRGPALIRAGMLLYDLLSFDKSVDRHHMLDRAETLDRVPGLAPDELKGASIYFDAQATFAERLAVENAFSATQHGATIITYARVDRIVTEGAVVRGVEYTDLVKQKPHTAWGKVVVNVAGPWVDQVLSETKDERLIGGTKGSHLAVAHFPGAPDTAIYYEAASDGRAIFVVPWNGMYLIGSTDIRYRGDLDDVRVDDSEIDYLLTETNRLLPKANLTPQDVLYSYSGVRPLPFSPNGREGAITRRHVIKNHAPCARGLLSVIGGKLTTHRSLAEEVVDKVLDQFGRRVRCRTATLPLPGAAGISIGPFRRQLIGSSSLPETTINRLVDLYGARATVVIALIEGEPALAEPFDEVTGAIAAEVVFAIREEMAETLTDILLRRTMVSLAAHAGIGPDQAAADIAVTHLGWSKARAKREVTAYRGYIERFRPSSLNR